MRRSFEPTELASFRATVARRVGLRFEESKLDELATVLRRRMEATNSPDVQNYLCLLGTSLPELRAVVGHLTIPETYFLRIPDHFRVLEDVVLPERIRAQKAIRKLNILSAGCASGEEPYTIAMLVRDRVDLAGWQVSISGVDVNTAAIAKGRNGRYSAWSLREITPSLKERYFRPLGRDFQLHDSILGMVALEEGNLMDPQAPFWKPNAYDVIFFRNAFMYLSPEAGQAVVARMARSLVSGGYLFMGPAETLRGLSHDFHLCHTHETFYYQLRSGGARGIADSAQLPATALHAETPPADINSDWANAIWRATERIRVLTRTPEPSRRSDANPAMPAVPMPVTPDLSTALGLLQEERFEEALAALQALPVEAQSDPDVQVLRAAMLANHGDLALAEEACAAVLKIDELNAGAHYVMALCRDQADDRRTANEHDLAAIYLDPSFAMPHLHLGLLAKRSGELELAMQELSQASLLLPREDAQRILLFGGGFSREALVELCRRELQGCRGLA